jgi:hypothetical protein
MNNLGSTNIPQREFGFFSLACQSTDNRQSALNAGCLAEMKKEMHAVQLLVSWWVVRGSNLRQTD